MLDVADRGEEWTPPGAAAAPPPHEASPRYGVRVPDSAAASWPPPTAAPPPGRAPSIAPSPPPAERRGTPGGWTPPPKPGLIPLHPLGFGALLGTAFSAIRWNPRTLVAPAVVVSLVQSAITVLGLRAVLAGATGRLLDASDADRQVFIAGAVGQLLITYGVTIAVSTVFDALLQGLVVVVVARGVLGQKPTIRVVLARIGRRFWRLLLLAVLESAALLVAFGVIAGVAALLGVLVGAAAGAAAGVVLGVLFVVFGVLGAVVLSIWVSVRIAVAPSVIVLERTGVVAALRRSWTLTRGSFWRTFGLLALPRLIVQIVAGVVSLPFQLLGSLLTTLVLPNGATDDVAAVLQASFVAGVPATAVTAIVAGIGLIAEVAALALLYIDLRMRGDGLDIRLRTLVETGEVGDQDPFIAPPA